MAKSRKGCLFSKTDYRKLRAGLDKNVKNAHKVIINALAYIGETAVKTARENGRYNDITGNLRSSIGYVVLSDGKPVVGGNFDAVPVAAGKRTVKRPDGSVQTIKVGGDGSEGQKQGKELLKKLQSKYPWGIVLIVVAGMNYAAYVEFNKDKDVLHSAEQVADALLLKLLGKYISTKE